MDRSAAFLNRALSFDNAFSIRLKSGLYGREVFQLRTFRSFRESGMCGSAEAHGASIGTVMSGSISTAGHAEISNDISLSRRRWQHDPSVYQGISSCADWRSW